MARFTDRVAIITGAASGLGRATARRLADEGAAVACVDLAADGAKETVADIEAGGGVARAYGADVADPGSARGAVDAASSDLGRPEVLVNCAGIGRFSHTTEQTFEGWSAILAVNLTGTFLMCQAVLPYLLDGGGSIVNVASNAGLMGQPYSAAYCASKSGVVGLTKALAVEYRKRNVRVNAVAPGGMNTPMMQTWGFPEGATAEDFAAITSVLGYSEPEEIAGLIAFVASDDGRYMVGQILTMDGGVTCG